jgi:hypothetical protein
LKDLKALKATPAVTAGAGRCLIITDMMEMGEMLSYFQLLGISQMVSSQRIVAKVDQRQGTRRRLEESLIHSSPLRLWFKFGTKNVDMICMHGMQRIIHHPSGRHRCLFRQDRLCSKTVWTRVHLEGREPQSDPVSPRYLNTGFGPICIFKPGKSNLPSKIPLYGNTRTDGSRNRSSAYIGISPGARMQLMPANKDECQISSTAFSVSQSRVPASYFLLSRY